MSLDGDVVLISGVGPGLGSEVARHVLEAGGRVVLGDIDGARSRGFLVHHGVDSARGVALEADITSGACCEEIVDLASSAFGRLDGIAHVAALDLPSGGLLDGDLADWSTVADVNVKGTLQLTKAAVPLLQSSGGGSVVMVGSIAALEPTDGVVKLAYGMSKAALAVGAYYLSRELGPLGIRINTVAPGWKWGPRLVDALTPTARRAGTDVETLLAPVREQISLRRFATDTDVAKTIRFLLSEDARAITGQVIYVDGGIGH